MEWWWDAVALDGLLLRFAPADLRGEGLVVLAALAQNGLALAYASAELRADRHFVHAAVRQNGHSLQYAAEALRGDREQAAGRACARRRRHVAGRRDFHFSR